MSDVTLRLLAASAPWVSCRWGHGRGACRWIPPEPPWLRVPPASFGWCPDAGSSPDGEWAEEGAPGLLRVWPPPSLVLFSPAPGWTHRWGFSPCPWPSWKSFSFQLQNPSIFSIPVIFRTSGSGNLLTRIAQSDLRQKDTAGREWVVGRETAFLLGCSQLLYLNKQAIFKCVQTICSLFI